jgi:hypothetical protein
LRSLPLALLAAAALLAGCGGHTAASPESVARAWSKAINTGDNEAAASLFAPGAVVIQDTRIVLRNHADAVAWNAGLPCAGKITDVSVDGENATVTFVLGMRPGQVCGGPGEPAAAIFTVRNGKIVVWHQIPPPGGNSGAPAI